ncbi:MAG: DUF1896 family protein [Weeksellaceae bacterium]
MYTKQKELSYFRLRLQVHPYSSFPEKAWDENFIEQCSTLAANAYEGAFLLGNTSNQCNEIANYVLFESLHFSKFDTIFQVVCNEFDMIMADEELRPFALKMFPVYGVMAKEPETASMNFLRALEKLPAYIKKEQEKITEIKKDLPVLQEVLNSTWSKEGQLNELKTELASIERKIQLSIEPENKEESTEQIEQKQEISGVSENTVQTRGFRLSQRAL